METHSHKTGHSGDHSTNRHAWGGRVVAILLLTNVLTLILACVALFALIWHTGLRAENESTPDRVERERANRSHPASSQVVPSATKEESTPEPDLIEGTVTKTASLITDVRVAGGGKWVVLRLQESPDLAIYDTEEMKIVRTLRFGDTGFCFSAGGNIVLTYYPGVNILETWDIANGSSLKRRTNPRGVQITNITMGSSNDRMALIRYAESRGRTGICLLDIATLQEIPSESDQRRSFSDSLGHTVHQRADSHMQTISEWVTSHSPSGLGLYRLSGNSWTHLYEHTSVNYIAVGDDGLLYTGSGDVFNHELTKVFSLRGMWLMPGIGGALFLGLSSDGQMQVYQSGSAYPIVSIGRFPGSGDGLGELSRHISSLGLDRHVVFAPKRGYLIIIPSEHDRIIQREFNLEGIVKDAGVEYLIILSQPDRDITPGETWQYTPRAISSASGIKFTLESAPSEMFIGENGMISWRVPFAEGLSASVVIRVEDESGQTALQKFELRSTHNAGSIPESGSNSQGVTMTL